VHGRPGARQAVVRRFRAARDRSSVLQGKVIKWGGKLIWVGDPPPVGRLKQRAATQPTQLILHSRSPVSATPLPTSHHPHQNLGYGQWELESSRENAVACLSLMRTSRPTPDLASGERRRRPKPGPPRETEQVSVRLLITVQVGNGSWAKFARLAHRGSWLPWLGESQGGWLPGSTWVRQTGAERAVCCALSVLCTAGSGRPRECAPEPHRKDARCKNAQSEDPESYQ
jgi:hypothetical protein